MNWANMAPTQRDALLAEKVMGLRVEHWTKKHVEVEVDGETETWDLRTGYVLADDPMHPAIPAYSTDISAAWQIAERFDEIIVSRHIPGKYHCDLYRGAMRYNAIAKTAQEAICLAALRSVGVDAEDIHEQTG